MTILYLWESDERLFHSSSFLYGSPENICLDFFGLSFGNARHVARRKIVSDERISNMDADAADSTQDESPGLIFEKECFSHDGNLQESTRKGTTLRA